MRRLLLLVAIAFLASPAHAPAADRARSNARHVIATWSTGSTTYTVFTQSGTLQYTAAYRTPSGSTGVNTAFRLPVSQVGCTQNLEHGKTLRIYSATPHGIRYLDEGTTAYRNWAEVDELPGGVEKALLAYAPIAAKLNACKSEVDLYHLQFVYPPDKVQTVLTYGYTYTLYARTFSNQYRLSTDGTLLFDDDQDTQPLTGRTIDEFPLSKISCVSKSYSTGNTLGEAAAIRINLAGDLDGLEKSYAYDTVETTSGITLTAASNRDLDAMWAQLQQASPIFAQKLRPSCAP